MKITKRRLRTIIHEALEEADNPCWDGYRPGAQSGRKTKIGKSGKRVANCEKISETDSPLKEQEISGPDLTRGKDFSVGGSGEGKAAAMASYDEMYYDLVDDYYAWVDENGHITPSASSVMASYFLERGLEDDHKKHKMLSKVFAVSHDDIMADVRRQKAERSAMMGESKMKITKRQLRRIIKEEKAKLLKEQAGSDLFANVQMLVDQQTSIFDMADRLKALGHRDANYVSGMGMRYVEVMHNGQKHVVISKNMVKPDASTQIIGPYAVGVLS